MAVAQTRNQLERQISDWNANRLDMFEITLKDENSLTYEGVMRFFFEDSSGKFSTTCLRRSSQDTAKETVDLLVVKFRPDMRMLRSTYVLYEAHGHDERMLADDEKPLQVQLGWTVEDREGQFKLKLAPGQLPPVAPKSDTNNNAFVRSRSGKKGKKRASVTNDNETNESHENHQSNPFTRTISNPENVVRRRRQMRIEKALASGSDDVIQMAIYPGDKLTAMLGQSAGAPVQLNVHKEDLTGAVIRDALQLFGLAEPTSNWRLVKVIFPGDQHGENVNTTELVLHEREMPWMVLKRTENQLRPNDQLRFYLDEPRADREPTGRYEVEPPSPVVDRPAPFLVEHNKPAGRPNPLRVDLTAEINHIGSSPDYAKRANNIHMSYVMFHGIKKLRDRHCEFRVVTNPENAELAPVVFVSPLSKDADVRVNDKRVKYGKKMLIRYRQDVVRIAGEYQFKLYINPKPQKAEPISDAKYGVSVAPREQTGQLEQRPVMASYPQSSSQLSLDEVDQLPLALDFPEAETEEFLSFVINDHIGEKLEFKLTPAYVLYLAARYRVGRYYKPQLSPADRRAQSADFQVHVAQKLNDVVQLLKANGTQLSFWLSNCSELFYFYRHDQDLSTHNESARTCLSQTVETCFLCFVKCFQSDLEERMIGMLNESDADAYDPQLAGAGGGRQTYGGDVSIEDIIDLFDRTMSLVRKNRVNAGFTIQLFSRNFAFMNSWLLDRLLLDPNGRVYLNMAWAERLYRRLGRIQSWCRKQGLELAADCYLAKVYEAVNLLRCQLKYDAHDGGVEFGQYLERNAEHLNSSQVRYLLEGFTPSVGEPAVSRQLVEVAVNQAMRVDKRLADEGIAPTMEDYRAEQMLPVYMLPPDGYSCDTLKITPKGLVEFIQEMQDMKLCRLKTNLNAVDMWTVFLVDQRNSKESGDDRPPENFVIDATMEKPKTITVVLNKINGSLGMTIVVTQGSNQPFRAVYVKKVVEGGAAAKDGRLDPGDQISEVDGHSLVDLSQEDAANILKQTGQTVRLTIVKNASLYHNLFDQFRPEEQDATIAAMQEAQSKRPLLPGAVPLAGLSQSNPNLFNVDEVAAVSAGMKVNSLQRHQLVPTTTSPSRPNPFPETSIAQPDRVPQPEPVYSKVQAPVTSSAAGPPAMERALLASQQQPPVNYTPLSEVTTSTNGPVGGLVSPAGLPAPVSAKVETSSHNYVNYPRVSETERPAGAGVTRLGASHELAVAVRPEDHLVPATQPNDVPQRRIDYAMSSQQHFFNDTVRRPADAAPLPRNLHERRLLNGSLPPPPSNIIKPLDDPNLPVAPTEHIRQVQQLRELNPPQDLHQRVNLGDVHRQHQSHFFEPSRAAASMAPMGPSVAVPAEHRRPVPFASGRPPVGQPVSPGGPSATNHNYVNVPPVQSVPMPLSPAATGNVRPAPAPAPAPARNYGLGASTGIDTMHVQETHPGYQRQPQAYPAQPRTVPTTAPVVSAAPVQLSPVAAGRPFGYQQRPAAGGLGPTQPAPIVPLHKPYQSQTLNTPRVDEGELQLPMATTTTTTTTTMIPGQAVGAAGGSIVRAKQVNIGWNSDAWDREEKERINEQENERRRAELATFDSDSDLDSEKLELLEVKQQAQPLSSDETHLLESLQTEREFSNRVKADMSSKKTSDLRSSLLNSINEDRRRKQSQLNEPPNGNVVQQTVTAKKVPPPVKPKPKNYQKPTAAAPSPSPPPPPPPPPVVGAIGAGDSATPSPPPPTSLPPPPTSLPPAVQQQSPSAGRKVTFQAEPVVSSTNNGVIGSQEVYNDPRERILAAKSAQSGTTSTALTFHDKMKMYQQSKNY